MKSFTSLLWIFPITALCQSQTSVAPAPWQTGVVTEDGTCGGADGFVCSPSWGACCSADGRCGRSVKFCGTGCQTPFGNCNAPVVVVPVLGPGSPTPDGSCGGTKGYNCTGASFGACCSSVAVKIHSALVLHQVLYHQMAYVAPMGKSVLVHHSVIAAPPMAFAVPRPLTADRDVKEASETVPLPTIRYPPMDPAARMARPARVPPLEIVVRQMASAVAPQDIVTLLLDAILALEPALDQAQFRLTDRVERTERHAKDQPSAIAARPAASAVDQLTIAMQLLVANPASEPALARILFLPTVCAVRLERLVRAQPLAIVVPRMGFAGNQQIIAALDVNRPLVPALLAQEVFLLMESVDPRTGRLVLVPLLGNVVEVQAFVAARQLTAVWAAPMDSVERLQGIAVVDARKALDDATRRVISVDEIRTVEMFLGTLRPK
ncbi:hypothetical protein VTL71DRAFT_6724 [Oculimacula yallundae]|uniref:Chitin-binding type-1 domain-containing protein n=1 Tax=Oculimacula yallundae TaxID=86028 RepID=A0ABR4BXU1_9HELO